MVLSELVELAQALSILSRIGTVIGSLILDSWLPDCFLVLLIPAWTLLISGSEECSLESGSPIEI